MFRVRFLGLSKASKRFEEISKTVIPKGFMNYDEEDSKEFQKKKLRSLRNFIHF